MYSSDELFQCSLEGYFSVHFPSCEATRKINSKITLKLAQKQFAMRIHTLFYFLLKITTINMLIKTTIFTHRPHAWLAGFMFCWWHHNRLLMTSQLIVEYPDNCDAITRVEMSNSLHIDFIDGNIQGQSCKKYWLLQRYLWSKQHMCYEPYFNIFEYTHYFHLTTQILVSRSKFALFILFN